MPLNISPLTGLIQARKVDVIVILMHWGREYRPRMNGLQRRIATYLTSLGVHVIIGSHPHVMQPYSYRDKRFVAYSLGNLLFSHEWTPEKFRVGYCLFLFFLFFLHCNIRLNLQHTTIAEDSGGRSRVGHYRVPKTLTFKTAKSQKWKTVLMISSFICMRTKNHWLYTQPRFKTEASATRKWPFFGGEGRVIQMRGSDEKRWSKTMNSRQKQGIEGNRVTVENLTVLSATNLETN